MKRVFGVLATVLLVGATLAHVGGAVAGAQSESPSIDDASLCGVDGCVASALPDEELVGGTFFAFRNGVWYIDDNANGTWDGCDPNSPAAIDYCTTWGSPGDIPVSNFPYPMVYRAGARYGDKNENGVWDGCAVDECVNWGSAGSIPVPGSPAVFQDGWWYADFGMTGWQGCAVDLCIQFGSPGDIPVLDEGGIGVFRNGLWYIEGTGNQQWNGCNIDRCLVFGTAGDKPFITPKGLIGVRRGQWTYLDLNDNGAWDGCGTDSCINFGAPTDIGGFIAPPVSPP